MAKKEPGRHGKLGIKARSDRKFGSSFGPGSNTPTQNYNRGVRAGVIAAPKGGD